MTEAWAKPGTDGPPPEWGTDGSIEIELAGPGGPPSGGDGPMPPFRREDYPGAVAGLEQVLVLPINELYSTEHETRIIAAIREEAGARDRG